MEPPPLPEATEPALSASRHVDNNLCCVQCGYNLRTLAVDAACPECNTPVQKTLTSGAEVAWLRHVCDGWALLILASICGFLASLAPVLPWIPQLLPTIAAAGFQTALRCVGFLVRILVIIGTFKATRRTAYTPDNLHTLGLAARLAVVAALLPWVATPLFSLIAGTTRHMAFLFGFNAFGACVIFGSMLLVILHADALVRSQGKNTGLWRVLAIGGTTACCVLSLISSVVIYQFVSAQQAGLANRPSTLSSITVAATSLSHLGLQLILAFFYLRCRGELRPEPWFFANRRDNRDASR